LEAADAVLAPLLGHSTRPWYRLPYGDGDARVAADVAPIGYTHQAGWTVDSLGWQGRPGGEIVARCLRLAAPGAIYLFHVGGAARDGLAIGAIVAGLRERGYGFATLEWRGQGGEGSEGGEGGQA
jgi:peptidoglycan/xylan/chitin deacetylase (PgdA/CDA1 family)